MGTRRTPSPLLVAWLAQEDVYDPGGSGDEFPPSNIEYLPGSGRLIHYINGLD